MVKRETVAVVLAAGRGTRMRSSKPKVLHEVLGRPLLEWVFSAARASGCGRIVCVVGHEAELVKQSLAATDVDWVIQEDQRGTGHAMAQTRSFLEKIGPASLLVLSGDVPLITAETLTALIDEGGRGWGAMAVADLEAPGSLGRVVGRDNGDLARIVEAADATPEELDIRKINAGTYVLPAPEVFAELDKLQTDNAQGELYLTDALSAAAERRESIRLFELSDPAEALGVNQRADLVRVKRAFVKRRTAELQRAGVTFWDPEGVWLEPDVEIGADTQIHAGVTLRGRTRIGEGCVIHQGAWLRDAVLADRVVVEPYSVVDGVEIGSQVKVGPFARLRPGTVIGEAAKIGNFVEVKNSRLESGVKAGHLAYIGDAEIGAGANVGAGAVTCNYDGEKKHRTTIGAGAFVGSDTMLVAPVRVGEGAVTAAGSVITGDVPDGALGVGRVRQRNIENWAERKKKGKK